MIRKAATESSLHNNDSCYAEKNRLLPTNHLRLSGQNFVVLNDPKQSSCVKDSVT